MIRPENPPAIYKNGRLKSRTELGLSDTNDLLACPFCGAGGETLMIDNDNKPFIYHCSNNRCQLHKVQFRLKQWNTRAS